MLKMGNAMTKTSKNIYFLITFVFFVIFNRYLTYLIINRGMGFPSNPLFDLTFIQNEGAAFNIFQGAKIFLILFSAFAVAAIVFSLQRKMSKLSTTAIFLVSLLLAGISCNMIECIHYGYVIDFIKLNFIDFPVFNISDIFINLSVLGILIIIIKNSYFKKS